MMDSHALLSAPAQGARQLGLVPRSMWWQWSRALLRVRCVIRRGGDNEFAFSFSVIDGSVL